MVRDWRCKFNCISITLLKLSLTRGRYCKREDLPPARLGAQEPGVAIHVRILEA